MPPINDKLRIARFTTKATISREQFHGTSYMPANNNESPPEYDAVRSNTFYELFREKLSLFIFDHLCGYAFDRIE